MAVTAIYGAEWKLGPPIARLLDATARLRKTRRRDGIGVDCPNEDHRSIIGLYGLNRMRWRPAESVDEMRRGLGGAIESVYNTSPRGGSDGNGPKQPLLRKLIAGEAD